MADSVRCEIKLPRVGNPFCGLPQQDGALWVAIIHLVMTFALFVHTTVKLALSPVVWTHEVKMDSDGVTVEKESDHATFSAVLVLIFGILLLVILLVAAAFHFFALFQGVQQKDVGRVRLWWRVMVIVTMLTVIFTVLVGVDSWVERSEALVFLLFGIYSLWVIYLYIQHLSGGSTAGTAIGRVVDNVVADLS